jgi:hypothetical protein
MHEHGPQGAAVGCKKRPRPVEDGRGSLSQDGLTMDGPMSPARPTHRHHRPSVRSPTNSSKRAYNLCYTDSCPDPT